MPQDMSSENTTDIRFDAPNEIAAAIDAIARGRRMTRNQWILKLMHDCVDEHVRVHSVLADAASRNPLVSEKFGKGRA